MKNEPRFIWDEEDGVATCILTDGKNQFVGEAICHDQDGDMKSEKTGCEIAAKRALIQYLTHIRDNELTPRLKALNQLYYNMKHSNHFNEKSYENKMLQRQIRMTKDDLATIKEELATTKQELNEYISKKEEFYQKVRKQRTTKQLQEEMDKN